MKTLLQKKSVRTVTGNNHRFFFKVAHNESIAYVPEKKETILLM